jgi:hypothetical protein
MVLALPFLPAHSRGKMMEWGAFQPDLLSKRIVGNADLYQFVPAYLNPRAALPVPYHTFWATSCTLDTDFCSTNVVGKESLRFCDGEPDRSV